MSWSASATGTAQYQAPPYAHGQPAFGQPQPYQYGQQSGSNQYPPGPTYPQSSMPPRPPENRPPKKKGNPIITRYPPPPGYRGPTQPHGPYAAAQYPAQYQQPQQTFPQGPPVPTAYSNPAYPAAPPTPAYSPQSYGPPLTQGHPQHPGYPQPGYQQAPQHQWQQQPQQSYPPQSGIPQTAAYPGSQGYVPPQGTHQSYPVHPTPIDPNQQTWNQAQGWQQPHSAAYPLANQSNGFGAPPTAGQPMADFNAIPTPTSANPTTSQNTPIDTKPPSTEGENDLGGKPQLFLACDDWDFDFDGAIWPKANEPIDPNLSLGVITWHPANQVTRALPSTFAGAEEQASKPPAEKLGNGESVSMFFTPENSHEAFLDVRQTDEWYKIRRDPIFVQFTDEDMASKLIPLEECVALRDRPDEPLQETNEDENEEIHDATWSVMDNLEQALSGSAEKPKSPIVHEDASSSRDQTQEDILAKLGVTGTPKPPTNEVMPVSIPLNTKLPASLPEKPPVAPPANIPPRPDQPSQRAYSYGGHRNSTYGPPPQRPYGSMSSSLHSRPPPPHGRPHQDLWHRSHSQSHFNDHIFSGSREVQSPAQSEGSNRTFTGSDFEPEKSIAVPQLKRSDNSFSRKRSYEDADQEDQRLRQQDDHSKRKRRWQVDSAYSRR